MRLTTIFKRNLVVLSVILASLVFAIIAFSGWNLYSHLVDEYRTKGVAVADSIASSGTELLLNRDASTMQALIDQFLAIEGVGYVFVIDREGEVLSHTFVPSVPEEVLQAKSSPSETVIHNVEVRGGKRYIDVAAPILAGIAGYVHVGMDTGIIMNSIRSAILVEIGLVMVLSLVSFLVIYFFFEKNINTPMSVLTNYANGLIAHDYSAVIDVRSGDEFETLAGALKYLAFDVQGMLERLDDSAWEIAKKDVELENTLNRLNAIVENMADGLLVTDTEGKVVRANRALLEMFHLTKDDPVGMDSSRFLGKELPILMKGFEPDGHSNSVSAEIELPGRRIGKALAAPIFHKATSETSDQMSEENVCMGTVTIIRDVTREKEIDHMKTDFISLVSHELRTPLTSILGFARIISKRLEDSIFPLVATEDRKALKGMTQVKENLHIIVVEGERLTAIINDVLDIAKMEAGKMDWRKEPVSVEEVIRHATASVRPLFDHKGLRLHVDIAEGLPQVTGDRDRLVQAMVNLLSNAVKFTDAGSVTCRASLSDEGILISIADTGIGIAEADIEKVFEKFKQVGDTLTDKPRGTGLGLPICRQIVQYHGGRIWVESAECRGSTIFITLPVETGSRTFSKTVALDALVNRLKEHVEGLPSTYTGQGRDILLVDDDAYIRRFLRQDLESEGYNITEAADGIEALAQVREKRPDLIVLDVMMPGMNGFDVAAVIRNDPVTMDIPIIILSIVEDLERGYRVGVDRYLTKPVDMDVLLGEIGTLISQGASRKKVMVVDENASTVEMLTGALAAKGYAVVNASRGDCLLKADLERPDMIIIDAVLSDRHDIVRTLRFNKGLERVVFVLLGNESGRGEDLPEGKPDETD
jgi:signal transduction histidine kinase/DNA-binding response OmpR family regulator